MAKRKRRNHSPIFKAQVAVAALGFSIFMYPSHFPWVDDGHASRLIGDCVT